jgi:rhodanese-related sulfurtransferase
MIVFASALIGLAVLGFFFSRSQSQVALINVQETHRRAASDSTVVLLDVRTPSEFSSGHIENALLIPVQELEQRIGELEPYRGKTIIAYCRSGNRSGVAAGILGKHGYTAVNMEGGVLRWKKEGLPLVTVDEQK